MTPDLPVAPRARPAAPSRAVSFTLTRKLALALVLVLSPHAAALAAGAPPAAPAMRAGIGHSGPGNWHGRSMSSHRDAGWHGLRHDGRQGWADRRRGRGMVFGGGWSAFSPGWSAFAPGWAEESVGQPRPVIADLQPVRFRLPEASDLPFAGQSRSPVGAPVLFSITDRSAGQSRRPSGARIVSASTPTPLAGGTPGPGGPVIIHLTAR